MSQPTAARPVFSTEDFRLVRKAVAEYIRANQEDIDAPKFVNLHHRLGRPHALPWAMRVRRPARTISVTFRACVRIGSKRMA